MGYTAGKRGPRSIGAQKKMYTSKQNSKHL